MESTSTAQGKQLQEEVKSSVVSNNPLIFDNSKDYTNANITKRWDEQRTAWLQKSAAGKSDSSLTSGSGGGTSLSQMMKRQARDTYTQRNENDVRGSTQSRELPEDEADPQRRQVRKIMKSQSGPYERFDYYYALEDIIDLYMEIWYDSDSSSDK